MYGHLNVKHLENSKAEPHLFKAYTSRDAPPV